MGRLEDLTQQLPPAAQALVVQLVEALIASWPPGPRVAPPPTRGRPRTLPPVMMPAAATGAGQPVAEDLADPSQVPALDAPVLEALKYRYPLVMTARHITQLTGLPHPAVRATLQALARRGLIESPNEGYYRFVAKEPMCMTA